MMAAGLGFSTDAVKTGEAASKLLLLFMGWGVGAAGDDIWEAGEAAARL